jgi:hypothetical protein
MSIGLGGSRFGRHAGVISTPPVKGMAIITNYAADINRRRRSGPPIGRSASSSVISPGV